LTVYDNNAFDWFIESIDNKVEKMAQTFTVTIVKENDEEFEFYLKMGDNNRQFIVRVLKDGPADRVGLKNNDELLEVDGVDVSKLSHDETVELIRKTIPDNKVTFKVYRSSNEKIISNSKPTKPRICKIEKKNGTFGFNLKGFAARQKQAHVIEKVVEKGPADLAGIKDDDRIIKVNKTNVEKMTHQQLVAFIRKCGNKLTLLVCDVATYHHYKSKKKKFSEKDVLEVPTKKESLQMSESSERSEVDPRQLHIFYTENGLGFYLRSDEKGEFAGSVDRTGSSWICGLRENDRIISVNGTSIENKSHDEVIKMIKSNPHHVIMVVGSLKSLQMMNDLNLEKTQTSKMSKPETFKMKKGEDGYGFYLKMEQGSTHHIVSDIEEGSVASKVGMKNGQILVAVNGFCILKTSHKECVKKINESGSEVNITLATKDVADIFQQLDIDVNEEFLESWPKDLGGLEAVQKIKEHKEEEQVEAPKIDEVNSDQVIDDERKDEVVEENHKFKPRFCHLIKDRTYGFHLNSEDDQSYISQVAEDGVADVAGLRQGDRIIEVNGTNIEGKRHKEVVEMILASNNQLKVLVVDEETDLYYKNLGIKITMGLLGDSRDEKSKRGSFEAEATVHKDAVEEDQELIKVEKSEESDKSEDEGKDTDDEDSGEKNFKDEDLDGANLKEEVLERRSSKSSENGEKLDEEEEMKREEEEKKKEEIRREAEERIKEDLRREAEEEEKIKREAEEKIKEDLRREAEEKMKEDLKREAEEKIKEDLRREAEEKIKEDLKREAEEKIKEDLRREAEEKMKEDLRREAEEKMKEDLRREVEEKVKEDLRREMEAQIKEDLRKEAEEKIKEEMRKEAEEKIKEETKLAEASTISIPEPPSPVLSTKREKADSVVSFSTTISDSSSTKNEVAKTSIDFSEISNIRLKPVNEGNKQKGMEKSGEKFESNKVQNSIKSRMQMFEKKKQSTGKSQVNKTSTKSNPAQNQQGPKKPFTFSSASSMKFKIVETTPVIN